MLSVPTQTGSCSFSFLTLLHNCHACVCVPGQAAAEKKSMGESTHALETRDLPWSKRSFPSPSFSCLPGYCSHGYAALAILHQGCVSREGKKGRKKEAFLHLESLRDPFLILQTRKSELSLCTQCILLSFGRPSNTVLNTSGEQTSFLCFWS